MYFIYTLFCSLCCFFHFFCSLINITRFNGRVIHHIHAFNESTSICNMAWMMKRDTMDESGVILAQQFNYLASSATDFQPTPGSGSLGGSWGLCVLSPLWFSLALFHSLTACFVLCFIFLCNKGSHCILAIIKDKRKKIFQLLKCYEEFECGIFFNFICSPSKCGYGRLPFHYNLMCSKYCNETSQGIVILAC